MPLRLAALWMILGLSATKAQAGTNPTAKIALHLQAPTSKERQQACDRAERPPCNDGQSSLNVQGRLGIPYYIYVMVLDGNVEYYADPAGIQGATFGIRYSPGLKISAWGLCADGQEERSTRPAWPVSGSGNVITWNSCQKTPAPGDEGGGVTAILGYFYAVADSDALLSIIPNPTIETPALQVRSCQNEIDDLVLPQAAGKVGFGSSSGYDPCKGPRSPFSEFQHLSSQELASLLIKITDLENGRLQSLRPFPVLLGPSAIENTEMLKSYCRLEFIYGYDFTPGTKYTITVEEIQGILNAISALPHVSDGGVDVGGRFSLGLFTTTGPAGKGFESILNEEDGRDLFARIRDVFTTPGVQAEIDQYTCSWGLLPTPGPEDITSHLLVHMGAFRVDGQNRAVTITVTNTSARTYPGPVSLVLNEGANAVVLNPDGRTCRLMGPSYLNLEVGSAFEPNEVAAVVVQFEVTNAHGLEFKPTVIAGPGVR